MLGWLTKYELSFAWNSFSSDTRVISLTCLSERNQIWEDISDSCLRYEAKSRCSQTNAMANLFQNTHLSEKQRLFLCFSDKTGLCVWEKRIPGWFLWRASEKCSGNRNLSTHESNDWGSEILGVSATPIFFKEPKASHPAGLNRFSCNPLKQNV